MYGLLAEFATAEALLDAIRRTRQAGYGALDAFAPYSVEGLATELGHAPSRVPFVVLVGGLVGAAAGFGMQYWTMAVDYPFNSGGRPLDSWPAFIPVTFELMVLLAAFGAFFAMMFFNGLPRLHHPLFAVPAFARASQYSFFLCVESADPRFDAQATREFLTGLAAVAVFEVPASGPGATLPSPVAPPAPATRS